MSSFRDNESDYDLGGSEFSVEFGPSLGTREKPLPVGELTQYVKTFLEGKFTNIVVVGEVSNFKAHPSGHYYFSLKDESASLKAVMFRGATNRVKFKLQNGQKVIAFGKLSVYPPQGSYQISCSHLEPEGLGSLQLAFEQLKQKLKEEGLFDESRKKPIPQFPSTVGVVTALSGAALRDILNVLSRRFSGLQVLIYPVKVQGEGAGNEVATAIQDFNQFFPQVDTLIVGRGGGSIEDLWAFNEEVVARAIADSKIPIISAVGHEIDFTISDFVADLRAPTPSAAAELVIANKLETLRHLDHLNSRLQKVQSKLEFVSMKLDELYSRMERSLIDRVSGMQLSFERLSSRLKERSPLMILRDFKNRLDLLSRDLMRIPERILERKTNELAHLESKLNLLNPKSIMERGYSLVRIEKTGKLIKKVSDVKMGDMLLIELSKGKLRARV